MAPSGPYVHTAGDDGTRCLNVSTLGHALFYRPGWADIHPKLPMMKRFFYPWKLLHCIYCPKLGKRFIKVGQTRFPEALLFKTHAVRRSKSTVYGAVIPVLCRHAGALATTAFVVQQCMSERGAPSTPHAGKLELYIETFEL